MNLQEIPAWADYSSQSDSDQDNDSSSFISEATKQLFLRKYSASSISENELLSIFSSCQYKDKDIKKKIDEKLKSLLITIPKDDVKTERDTYNYRQDKGNYQYSSHYTKKYNNRWEQNASGNHKGYYNKKSYGKNNKKKNYDYDYDYEESGNDYYYKGSSSNNNKYKSNKTKGNYERWEEIDQGKNETLAVIEINDFSNIKKDVSEIDEDQKTKATTPTRAYEVSNEIIPEISLNCLSINEEKKEELQNDFKLPHTFYTNNYYDNTKENYYDFNKRKEEEPKYFQSKLFPGVYFNKPIEPSHDITPTPIMQDKTNPFSLAFNYYLA